ncbi:diguanylate cyclase [Halomonas salinarum]|uniref:diguanylate cyclase n=1 Tax=Halomonas salinarum TaxID=1158993 RepID=UPI00143AF1C3|nr:diguanylate cyclase [Halomonas salinarum]
MVLRHSLCWLILLFVSVSGALHADTLSVSEDTLPVKLGNHLEYLEDLESKYSIDTVRSGITSEAWQRSNEDTLNFGYSGSTYWVRFALENKNTSFTRSMIEIAYPVLDKVNAFIFQEGELVTKYTMGDRTPFNNRPIAHHNFVFPVKLNPGEKSEVYLQVKSTSSLQIPVSLYQSDTLLEHKYLEAMWLAMFVGAMIIMAAFNTLILAGTRDISYFYYVMYVVSITLLFSGIHGLTFQFLWPNQIGLNDSMIVLALSGMVFFPSMFFRSFLQLPQTRSVLSKILFVLAMLSVLTAIGGFHLSYRLMIISTILLACAAISVGLWSGIRRWLDGFEAAKYLNIAWISMMTSGVILALNKSGLIPRDWFTENIVYIGASLEVVLLSLALAHRMNIERRMREAAQQESVRAQQELLEHQVRANEDLDKTVRQRTEELEMANAQLMKISATDSLTEMLNRRAFGEVFKNEYKRAFREQSPIAILMIDLDHFKSINDTYGHPFGDKCLQKTASVIRHNLRRPQNTAARYGGEEFIVLLPGTDREGARQVGRDILEELSTTEMVDNMSLRLTASIGVASHIPDSNTAGGEELVREADQRLYVAKESGRNRVE